MRRVAGMGLAVMAFGVLTGCGTSAGASESGPPSTRTTAPTPATRTAPAAGIPYELYTHCGIDEARIGSRYFEAVHPLDDGSGNPPEGWGNPFQRGRMTLVSETEAVFTDDAGHGVRFRVRPDATEFKHICQ